jgi:hypothetical protein
VFVGVAGYVGLAALLDDAAKRRLLPLGRRAQARAAIDEGLEAQLRDLETEAGVRSRAALTSRHPGVTPQPRVRCANR